MKKTQKFKYLRSTGTTAEFCCVPLCPVNSRYNRVLSFFHFPTDKELRRQWIVAICRKDFAIKAHTRVCSRHFKPEDIQDPASETGRRRLKKGAVPALFEWNNFSLPRPGVWERKQRPPLEDSEEDNTPVADLSKEHDYALAPDPAVVEKESLQRSTIAPGQFTGCTRLIECLRHVDCGESKMPSSCAAWNCTNQFTAQSRSNGITFHRFPKDEELRKRWEAAVRRVGFSASTSSVLCSDHFRPENLDRTGQRVRVRAGTVPSVFRFPSHLHGPADPRRSQTSKKSRKILSLDWSQLMQEDEPLPWKHDHSYALPSSKDELRARLREALARVESLEEDLRSKSTESDLLEDLRVKKLINEEFKEQLDTSYSEDQQLLVIKEEEDLHLWSSSLDQQDVELVKIKEEEEELWTNQEGEQLAVRSEDDDTPEVFQLHRIKAEDRETQTNGEDCGGPEPDRTPGPLGAERQPEDQQLLLIKKEQDLHLWSSSLDQQDIELVKIKEEEEELKINQEGEQLAVRSEDDDTPEVFQLHRIEVEDNRETQTDNGEVCGGPEPHRNHDPNILQTKNDQRASDSSETEVSEDETDYWMETVSVSGSAKEDYDWREPLSSELAAKSKLGRKSSKKTFSCLECFKSFPNKPLFQKHMSTHSGEGPSSLVVQNIETRCKNREKPFSCGDCGKTFSFPSQLKHHTRVHTGQKPFSCVDCGKMFRFPSQLKCHTRVHTREKPFSCVDCGKMYRFPSQLTFLLC